MCFTTELIAHDSMAAMLAPTHGSAAEPCVKGLHGPHKVCHINLHYGAYHHQRLGRIGVNHPSYVLGSQLHDMPNGKLTIDHTHVHWAAAKQNKCCESPRQQRWATQRAMSVSGYYNSRFSPPISVIESREIVAITCHTVFLSFVRIFWKKFS